MRRARSRLGINDPPPPPPPGSGFTNSDLAFQGTHAIVGNYHGFNTYDIENAQKPRLVASIVCPGGQGDVSIHGNLLFMSVEQTRGRIDCGLQGVQDPVSKERFRGVRIFDITDLRKPRQVAAVQTCRGSHTHTLVTDPRDRSKIYIYGSGTGAVRSGDELAGCSGLDPKEDPNTALFSIDVIEVPLALPSAAKIVNRPRIFADEKTGALSGLWQGGNHGEGTQTSRLTNQCHDITVFPSIGLAAGACSGNGILMDISDPVNPKRLDHVVDKSFAYWHSATFNNDATKVVFTDEWGGGTRPRCQASSMMEMGGNTVLTIANGKFTQHSYFKIPTAQTAQENCVSHNGGLIPVPGRDIMVQGWYQGGVSVMDFTDPDHPFEIAFFDRGSADAPPMPGDTANARVSRQRGTIGGSWGAYYWNGYIYSSELARGLDILELVPTDQLSANELAAARLVTMAEYNPQNQPKIEWPAGFPVVRSYLDQLTRNNGLSRERLTAIASALNQAERQSGGARRSSLERLAGQVDGDVASARDQTRVRAMGAAIRALAAQ